MLAQIRNSFFGKFAPVALLSLSVLTFTSCATKQPPPLISDGTTGRESSLPWNQQKDWEQQGQLGQMADAVNSRR
jgi:hypothetical protein